MILKNYVNINLHQYFRFVDLNKINFHFNIFYFFKNKKKNFYIIYCILLRNKLSNFIIKQVYI